MAKKQSEDKKAKKQAPDVVDPDYQPRLRVQYHNEVRPALREELGLRNIMQTPRVKKIVVNMGVGEGSRDIKLLQQAEEDMATITGQKPRRNKAKLSVAAFKLRKGMPVGCSVTLRGRIMYEFLERLINVAIPRIRDFRGLSPKACDGHGNYNFGVREHLIFTEIDSTDLARSRGMNVTIVTSAANNDHCLALLRHFGMPFREN